jgi:hypothetical protein
MEPGKRNPRSPPAYPLPPTGSGLLRRSHNSGVSRERGAVSRLPASGLRFPASLYRATASREAAGGRW